MLNHLFAKLDFIQMFIVPALMVACLIAAPAQADLGDELFKFTPSDGSTVGRFGYAVGISGNAAIVGSPYDDAAATSSGSARLFNMTTGQELLKVIASDGAVAEWFGIAVGISGNRAIVGSPNDAAVGPTIYRKGAAYLFDVGTGLELFKLTASDAAVDDFFGCSVAISGNLAIIGSKYDDDAGDYSGSAYLFNVTTGQELFKLTASDGAPFRQFGGSVDISGNVAIVGAQEGFTDRTDPGSAYLFNGTTGQELLKLTASDGAAGDQFGVSVAISGNVAIVGALRDDDAGRNSGSAYLFDVTTGQQLFKLTASDAAAEDLFGLCVAISGNMAIVGSSRFRGANTSGFAYLFDVTTGEQLTKFVPSDAAANDAFGFSVDISSNLAIVGAAYGDRAYVFSVVPEPASLALLALGLPLLAWRHARRSGDGGVCGGGHFDLGAAAGASALARSNQFRLT